MKTTLPILHDKQTFEDFDNAVEILKVFLSDENNEVNERRRGGLFHCLLGPFRIAINANDISQRRGVCLRDLNLRDLRPIEKDVRIVNLHPTNRTHWVTYTN